MQVRVKQIKGSEANQFLERGRESPKSCEDKRKSKIFFSHGK